MSLRKIFCNHIWKTDNIYLKSKEYKYILNTPLDEISNFVINSRCLRCGKNLVEYSKKIKRLSVEERDGIREINKKFTETG